ncbi:site-specific integrase [Pseudomonas sp. R5(2019)]|uniref:site-specific integrase n=1 Tax=Pseudomonas sp. R5(2019) TaxID=2697566 RepID=UPI00141294A9|nr:site-specific integrase [Pseudomonas sp. R5(2019)]NBA95843.1 tyrosine-type recombinase/integrase [Pseudomonas sp. R5(2019)]
MANNLENQDGTWHVRLAIPADVQKAFGGRKILSKSLGTGLRSEAMNRRLPYLTQWKAEIATAREQLKALKESWRPELAAGSLILEKDLDGMLLASVKPDEDADRVKEDLLAFLDQRSPGLRTQLEAAPRPTVAHVQRTTQLIREAAVQMAEGTYSLTAAEVEEAKRIVHRPSSYKPKSPITTVKLAAFRSFREDRAVDNKTVDQQESKLKKLSAFLAETGKALDFDCVSAWLDSLKVVPKTKAQYLLAGNMFWNWAMKYDAQWRQDFKGAVSPFEKHDLPQLRGKERVEAQRSAFELAELSTLRAKAHTKGLHTLADLILLGAYTGARIEELCQLRTEHIVMVDGVQSFDIKESKTAAGIRVVPIHPALTALVQRLKDDAQDGFLVPSASRNKYGNRSDPHSKAFGRLKSSLGFGSRHVFHSIRATVVTLLSRADVPFSLIAELVGHETGTVTFDVYSKGASAAQKLAAISKLPTLPASTP